MTSNDGPGSSSRIIEDQYITAPISSGGDGITVYGSDGPVLIRRCVVDLAAGRWRGSTRASPGWTGPGPW